VVTGLSIPSGRMVFAPGRRCPTGCRVRGRRPGPQPVTTDCASMTCATRSESNSPRRDVLCTISARSWGITRSTLPESITPGSVPILHLARISHQLSAAATDPGMSTALRSVGRLDVLSSTPAAPSGRAPCIHARLRRLATKSGEKSGLGTSFACSKDAS
jgi:hypothetical protein